MEIYKDIPNYEGLYQVSNLGNVKSLERKVKHSVIGFQTINEKILKTPADGRGYKVVALYKNGKRKSFKVHQLVCIVFLNHNPNGNKFVVDHIDNNKLNNRLSNLQVVTNRLNSSKDRKGKSKYTGVSWKLKNNKWQSSIIIKGKNTYLGLFKKEYDAHLAYQKALKEIKNDRKSIT